MTQYIDKSDIVAEIERRMDFHHKRGNQNDSCVEDVLYGVLSYINSLEVKEVGLDKETTHYLLYEHHSPLNEIMHKADLKSEMQYHKDIENAFKAGFKLGLNTQHSSINIPNIDDALEEKGIDPNSKTAKIFKESYYTALEKFKSQKGEKI